MTYEIKLTDTQLNFDENMFNFWKDPYGSPTFTTASSTTITNNTMESDPSGKDPHMPGAKVDAGKNRVWLCVSGFSRALEEVSKITTAGATKYTPNGWVSVENGQERYMDAFGRHLLELGKGNKFDDGPGGTGGLHKAQMIWNLLASLELELRDNASSKNS